MCRVSYYVEFLRFETAERSFCLDVDQVLGIITVPPFMKDMPRFLPFQDQTVSVYSLDGLLGLETGSSVSSKEVIVLRGPSGLYGLAVDWVGEICKIPVQRCVFQFPSSRRSRIRMFGVWGMAVLEQELALVLEPYQLLQEEQSIEPPFSYPEERIRAREQSLPLAG
ncbi:MAG: chemotaxis protein CheW [bacterium]